MSKLVALAGNPDVGKSIVFKELTCMNRDTGNWIGKKAGTMNANFYYKYNDYELVDLPSTYSLNANSAREQIAIEYLKRKDLKCVIYVLDATHLERSLLLLYQIMEINPNIIILANLYDKAKKMGIAIDFEALSKALNLPVVKATAMSGKGINNLLYQIDFVCNDNNKLCPNKVKYNRNISEDELTLTSVGTMKFERMDESNLTICRSDNKVNFPLLGKILVSKFIFILISLLIFVLTLYTAISFFNVPVQLFKPAFDGAEIYLYNWLINIITNDLFIIQ